MTSAVPRTLRALFGLLVMLMTPVGCSIGADPDYPPPIEPLPPEARATICVAPFENDSPSPEVAQWSYATRRFLIALLERSRRFQVVPSGTSGAPTLHVRFTDVRDEPYLESVVFAGEQRTGVKRRAMVAIHWYVEGSSEAAAELVSHNLFESADPLPVPRPDELESGSFWETPFGLATRQALDLLVRDLCDRSTPVAAR